MAQVVSRNILHRIGSHPIRIRVLIWVQWRWRDLQVLDQPQWQAQLLELSLNLSLGCHFFWRFARGDKVRQDPCEQCRRRLRLIQCQPLDETLATALASGNRIALIVFLDEASLLDCGYDFQAQVTVEATLAADRRCPGPDCRCLGRRWRCRCLSAT
jgi:hypothetical protein